MIFTKIFYFNVFTSSFCTHVICICNILHIQAAITFFFFRQCFIKLFLFIHIFVKINTFSKQQNKFIDIITRKLNVFLNHFFILHQSYLNSLYCKKWHLYFINFFHIKKQSQYLHLIF